MKIENGNIGELEFEESNVLSFSEGMLGLPEYKRYILIQDDNMQPFLRLQCVDAPQISFLMIDPAYADPGYKAYVTGSDPNHVFIDQSEEIVLLVVCTVHSGNADVTANMQAPVIINHKTMNGRQIILLDSPYSLRHSLVKNAHKREA